MSEKAELTSAPVSEAGDKLTVCGQFIGEFTDTALTDPFRDQPFTVIFRPETKIAPLVLHGTEIDLSDNGKGQTTYTLWACGGHGRRIVGAFNASELIGIVRGSRHLQQNAT